MELFQLILDSIAQMITYLSNIKGKPAQDLSDELESLKESLEESSESSGRDSLKRKTFGSLYRATTLMKPKIRKLAPHKDISSLLTLAEILSLAIDIHKTYSESDTEDEPAYKHQSIRYTYTFLYLVLVYHNYLTKETVSNFLSTCKSVIRDSTAARDLRDNLNVILGQTSILFREKLNDLIKRSRRVGTRRKLQMSGRFVSKMIENIRNARDAKVSIKTIKILQNHLSIPRTQIKTEVALLRSLETLINKLIPLELPLLAPAAATATSPATSTPSATSTASTPSAVIISEFFIVPKDVKKDVINETCDLAIRHMMDYLTEASKILRTKIFDFDKIISTLDELLTQITTNKYKGIRPRDILYAINIFLRKTAELRSPRKIRTIRDNIAKLKGPLLLAIDIYAQKTIVSEESKKRIDFDDEILEVKALFLSISVMNHSKLSIEKLKYNLHAIKQIGISAPRGIDVRITILSQYSKLINTLLSDTERRSYPIAMLIPKKELTETFYINAIKLFKECFSSLIFTTKKPQRQKILNDTKERLEQLFFENSHRVKFPAPAETTRAPSSKRSGVVEARTRAVRAKFINSFIKIFPHLQYLARKLLIQDGYVSSDSKKYGPTLAIFHALPIIMRDHLTAREVLYLLKILSDVRKSPEELMKLTEWSEFLFPKAASTLILSSPTLVKDLFSILSNTNSTMLEKVFEHIESKKIAPDFYRFFLFIKKINLTLTPTLDHTRTPTKEYITSILDTYIGTLSISDKDTLPQKHKSEVIQKIRNELGRLPESYRFLSFHRFFQLTLSMLVQDYIFNKGISALGNKLIAIMKTLSDEMALNGDPSTYRMQIKTLLSRAFKIPDVSDSKLKKEYSRKISSIRKTRVDTFLRPLQNHLIKTLLPLPKPMSHKEISDIIKSAGKSLVEETSKGPSSS